MSKKQGALPAASDTKPLVRVKPMSARTKAAGSKAAKRVVRQDCEGMTAASAGEADLNGERHDAADARSGEGATALATADDGSAHEVRVRRMHRRDINKIWEFLKLVFRDVNRETVEFQRPRHKKHFVEIYEEDGIEQLVFELKQGDRWELAGYAEYAYEIVGSDSWMNHRYFERRNMRPLFVEEIAVHPDWHGMGIGTFMFEQIDHAARRRGCTHIVLEVAENNEEALQFYRKRKFQKLDAAIFLSRKLDVGDDLLAPRKLKRRPKGD